MKKNEARLIRASVYRSFSAIIGRNRSVCVAAYPGGIVALAAGVGHDIIIMGR
jgi:hypothetical protein